MLHNIEFLQRQGMLWVIDGSDQMYPKLKNDSDRRVYFGKILGLNSPQATTRAAGSPIEPLLWFSGSIWEQPINYCLNKTKQQI